MNELSLLDKDRNSFGLIHGDINLENFFLDGNRITIFDFDECQYSWFEDIARKFMDKFVEGYRLENSIGKWNFIINCYILIHVIN